MYRQHTQWSFVNRRYFHDRFGKPIPLISRCNFPRFLVQVLLLVFDDEFVALHDCCAAVQRLIFDDILAELLERKPIKSTMYYMLRNMPKTEH